MTVLIGTLFMLVFVANVYSVVLPSRHHNTDQFNGYAYGLQKINFADRSRASALAVQHKDNGCFCLNDTCACCRHLDIPRFNINDTGCVEMVYLRHDIGFSLLFTIDDHVVINRTISARNPPAICYGVPHISAADLCLQFYNLDYTASSVSGCIRVKAELADIDIYEKDLGCFRIPMYMRGRGPLWDVIRQRTFTFTPLNSSGTRFVYGRGSWMMETLSKFTS
ncbi:uncharacterized protein LOC129582991 [Paramacrobiotus metropolitanus]|uniref:uncharacterized protein LOC129582991 n=1 Tax=Paramacrobiotus metropolitanus TaxID=2943436 RepID=UPI0024463660|nr:uncharacterized protein LOC129582991 [Paramacrobiotus metropolitanus]